MNNFPGPKFSRAELETLASGSISSVFGDWFAPLEQYKRLIRPPAPPLLFIDRVLGIEGEAGSLGRGTIWTETDVTADAWYLHQGRMPIGFVIESGQSNLLLLSWLGFDFHNRGDRVYRVLGGELCFHDELPKPGETLRFEIQIENCIKQGDIYLFFMRSQCTVNNKLLFTAKNCQAGLFSREELSSPVGVVWDAQTAKFDETLPHDALVTKSHYRAFNRQQLQDFSRGDVLSCFGPGFEKCQTHLRTPRIPADNLLMIDEISLFDPQGGPWKRGYLRATRAINVTDWYFKSHFLHDQCMPATLMLEGAIQTLTCFMTALGFTLDRDGWRFELINETNYKLRCRGQVTPATREIVYEIFVSRIISAPIPMVYADLLGTIDGKKSIHTTLGLRLVPDWPLSENDLANLNHIETKPIPALNNFKFDYRSLLALSKGKPSAAFGEFLRHCDHGARIMRLPNDPYLFITRITSIQPGRFEFEYDVPAQAWYFQDNANPKMPFCVFIEMVLQPCIWAFFSATDLQQEAELFFRNLDNTLHIAEEISPQAGTIRTRVTCTNISKFAETIIQNFTVEAYQGEKLIAKIETVCGAFSSSALENQNGLATPIAEMNALDEPSNFYADLQQQPCPFNKMLLMIDRVTGLWPQQGRFQKGRIRGEKSLNPNEWFFKAHFFQDPVQPGSLGMQAILQLLQYYMLTQNLHQGIAKPRFKIYIAEQNPWIWKYRGQILPTHHLIQTLVDVVQSGHDQEGPFMIADASQWVDGKRIYEAKNIGLRIVDGCQPHRH